MLEKQFRGYYEEASRRPGKTGENLLQLLECRLDNVVYRAGFAARGAMRASSCVHGHFLVNGHKVDIPSFQVSQYDIIDVKREVLGDDTVHRGARDPRRAGRPGLDGGSSRAGCGS